MVKYGRNYILEVETSDHKTITVELPFTVEFDIHRNSFSSANASQIRVYNLNPDHRSQIRKDQFDYADIRQIWFQAGYGDNLATAFKGNITMASSVREGVNFISNIESFDGGYAYVNAIAPNTPFPAGTTEEAMIVSLAKSMPGTTLGAIGSYPKQIERGNSFTGPTPKILSEISGNSFFIDNGKVNVLKSDECLAGDTLIVNPQSGLLGTPVKENAYINVEMLFEPSIRIAQLVNLQSGSADHLNGIHKVISIKHRGVISSSVSGTAITQLGLLSGKFNPVQSRSS